MKIHRIDHVGIIVNNLPIVKAFFLEFGLEFIWEGEVDSKWAERIIGKSEGATVVLLGTPDGQAKLELVKFKNPLHTKEIEQSLANHIAFAVEDIDAIVAKIEKNGAELFGDIQTYVNASYKVCYVRGPEGIILELAEKIG